MKEIKYISVDFQKEFTDPNGIFYNKGSSIKFIKNELVNFIKHHKIEVHEIISDYRLPRLDRRLNSCVPGTFGFESDLPSEIVNKDKWIKCMHNPTWIREGIGDKNLVAGEPYQNVEKFNDWLLKHIGHPDENKVIILFGLTLECCVLSVSQELYFRGYRVEILYNATDPMNERIDHKNSICYHSSLAVYSRVITFDELLKYY